MTSIIQWNINGFFKRSVDINRVLFELNPLILCFQETNLKNPQPPILKNYTGYIKNRTVANRACGGVATFIRKNIESKEVTIQTHLETIATLVELDRQTCICNIYIPDSTPFTSSDIKHIINQLPKPFIIMGDFNSRNTAWGCNITDSRGKIIEQIIEHEQSLILLNNGDPTRFNSFNGSLSAIDLTITSSNLVPSIEWQVLTSYSGSDHWPIEIRIQNKNTSYDPPLKWNLSKPNWKLFSELIEHDLLHNPIDLNANITQEHIDSIVNVFSNTILKAANIGIKPRNNKHKTTPWWNSECNNAIRKYKQALNRFKKTKDPSDHILLKKSRAEARYITKTSKTQSWKNFTSTINHKIDPSAVWNKIQTLKGYKTPHTPDRMRDNLNNIYSSPDSVSEAFAKFFQNNNSDQNYSDEFLAFKNSYSSLPIDSPSTNEHCFNLPLNLSELLSVLQNSKSKSPGPDCIPNSFIQNLPENGITTLLQIFNSIWIQGIFPNQWRNTTVIPIPKPGKNKFEIHNYRPISLINTMSKVLEKIINKRLI
jgi:exonuclease III